MAEIVNISPTLIIGLGGTGSYAVQYVKRKIRERLQAYMGRPLPPHVPFIEYLVIDTTAQEEMLEKLVPDEHLNIGRLNISRIIAELELGSDDFIMNWFPKNLDPGQIDSGAGGVRHIGRLCFFIRQAEIENAISGKVATITKSENIRNFINEHLPGLNYQEGSTIDVHIVSSLCGGTGSACLLDTAYLVKHVISDKQKQQPNSSAHLITTEPFENEPGVGRTTVEYIHSNFAVTLSEIEHFTKKDAPQPWEVIYRNGTVVSSKEKPFSTVYLLGCKDGVSLSKQHVCEIIGDAIAINTVHPEGRRIKGIIENFKPHVINTEDIKGKRRTYSSYNARVLNLKPDGPVLKSAYAKAARSILRSLCDERKVTPEEAQQALQEYEVSVFAGTEIRSLSFAEFRNDLEGKVRITANMYEGACTQLRNVSAVKSWRDKPNKGRAAKLANNVLSAYQAQNAEAAEAGEVFLLTWETRFKRLLEKTELHVNALMSEHSLTYVKALMESISARLTAFLQELDKYKKERLPDVDLYREIVAACSAGSVEGVPAKCAQAARSEMYGKILTAMTSSATGFSNQVNSLASWCEDARQCLKETLDKLPEVENRLVPASYTTSSVWTEEALEGLIETYKSKLVGRLIKLLEENYSVIGATDTKASFLMHLNKRNEGASEVAKELVQKAAREVLDSEVRAAADIKRQKALGSMHELIDLASPPWQIERLGEDLATASVTTCPRDSESGQIFERSGKNINFSSNGSGGDEFILFRSEHGVSVNHLTNFGRCLKAVHRKLLREEKERISELSLDPNGWNISTPLPILEDIRRLRLYFSLGIHYGVIDPQMNGYEFRTQTGTVVKLKGQANALKKESKGVRRYEAFESLLDLDCEGAQSCAGFRKQMEDMIEPLMRTDRIHDFRSELMQYLVELERLKKLADKANVSPERVQIEKEIESVQALVDEIDKFLEGLKREEELNRDGDGR